MSERLSMTDLNDTWHYHYGRLDEFFHGREDFSRKDGNEIFSAVSECLIFAKR